MSLCSEPCGLRLPCHHLVGDKWTLHPEYEVQRGPWWELLLNSLQRMSVELHVPSSEEAMGDLTGAGRQHMQLLPHPQALLPSHVTGEETESRRRGQDPSHGQNQAEFKHLSLGHTDIASIPSSSPELPPPPPHPLHMSLPVPFEQTKNGLIFQLTSP